MTTIATVTGETTSENLGKTLMHEHLVIGYPGFESHTTNPGDNAEERFAICVDKTGPGSSIARARSTSLFVACAA